MAFTARNTVFIQSSVYNNKSVTKTVQYVILLLWSVNITIQNKVNFESSVQDTLIDT